MSDLVLSNEPNSEEPASIWFAVYEDESRKVSVGLSDVERLADSIYVELVNKADNAAPVRLRISKEGSKQLHRLLGRALKGEAKSVPFVKEIQVERPTYIWTYAVVPKKDEDNTP